MKRSYQTAYSIAKIFEGLSWVLMAAGVIGGVVFMFNENIFLGLGVAIGSIVVGMLMVFIGQLVLIIIETENNTRIVAEATAQTNQMLSETLGGLLVNVTKIANKDEQ